MSPVQASAPRALVGRAAELSVLDRRVAEAAGGRGGLVFIAGEPGIGKSRLAEEAGRRAYGRGGRVVWGRCRETEGAPPFWPWTQVLRGLLGDTRGGDLGDLGPLLEGGARAPEAADRFRLFDAVLALLSECADRQPLVLILDDLHRADSASLLLLDFVAPALRDRAVLLVGTLRTTEIAPALFAVVGERAAAAEVLARTGLGVTDIGRLADALAPADARLSAEDLHRRSDGNPFFVTELLRLGPESGESVPATVGAAIAARVPRLPEATRRILTMAAVA